MKLGNSVRILKLNQETGQFSQLKRGTIVGIRDRWIQVFNRDWKRDGDDYDTTIENAQWYPIESKILKAVKT